MRRLVFALALLIIPASIAVYASMHGKSGSIGVAKHGKHDSLNIHGDDCTARNFRWNGDTGYVARETIDGRGLRSIKASVSHASVSVIGDSSSGYSIDVCKAAARAEDLGAIQVSLAGEELRATGPDHRRWTVLYRIHVPRNAEVEIDAKNGPVSFRDVDGKVIARSQNGPLSLLNVSGEIDATAKNGPIDIDGGSGNVKLLASNGPLTVNLDGNAWLGGTLDASTKNGPLSVNIPRGYGSGVIVESSGRGPLSCQAEGCGAWREERRRAADDDDDDFVWNDRPRRIELGNGRADVRLSTVNGPVTIREDG